MTNKKRILVFDEDFKGKDRERWANFYKKNLEEFELTDDTYSLADGLICKGVCDKSEGLIEKFVEDDLPCFVYLKRKVAEDLKDGRARFFRNYSQLFNAVRDCFRE